MTQLRAELDKLVDDWIRASALPLSACNRVEYTLIECESHGEKINA